ncbi:S1/P1 nuclease [Ceratobasidium sp. AG-Ba]|nr:S1/P1 nuclease [Ceratobasidium sp. AG-Ba]
MRASAIFLPVLSLAPSAFAWGALGHRTVAVVAQNYLSSATKTWVTNILGDTLANVATWADDYRSTTDGKFSSGFHYIDAEDSPPSSCSVSYSRDCAGGCIVSAMSLQTSRVQQTSLSASERTIALKFITHFLGDVTQPLHDENYETGGNVWDTSIPEKYVGGNSVSYATTWANQIIAKLASGGAYASSKASWLSCVDPSTAQTCSLAWASDANAIVCSYVLKTDPSGKELSTTYYTGALPLVEQQIAKGELLHIADCGIRLAAYLNMIVTGSTGF